MNMLNFDKKEMQQQQRPFIAEAVFAVEAVSAEQQSEKQVKAKHFFSSMHSYVVLLGYILKYSWSNLSLPSASDILRYILSCRASAIYGLPINLRYI